jgi:polyisoprenyl-teichoic acid--peptidoglycan teichoic acid transferase
MGGLLMRIPQWFVVVWVLVFGVIAILGAVYTHGFVQERTRELDDLLSLPRPARPFHLAKYFVDLLNPPEGKQTPAPTSIAVVEPTTPPVEITPAPVTAEVVTPTTTVAPASTAEATLPASEPSPTPQAVSQNVPAYTDPRRVNVLLLGIDQRQGEQGPFPTDTIILLSIDPVGRTAVMLSIPRDLWVEYPNGQVGKINAANIVGDAIQYPGGGGPAMALDTVEQMLGVKINFYVLINFEVFTALIDAVGPVTVCPSEPIDDNQYPDGSYGYITVHFDAGCQELDSERLLQYARTRHDDQDGDIGRSRRQQEVIMAARDKVLSAGGVIALLPEVTRLWESLQANFRTDMKFEDMIGLAQIAETIPSDSVQRGQISYSEVYPSVTADGEEILVPIPSDIGNLMAKLSLTR